MKRRAVVEGHARDIEVSRLPSGELAVLLDGKPVAIDLRELAPGVYSLLLGGRSFEVRVWEEASPDGDTARIGVSLYDDEYVVDLLDPRRGSGIGRGAAARGVQKLAAPMHGKVVRVLAQPGQRVKRGQGLVVVEAMKMQNELKASRDGVVTDVRAKEGQPVHQGDLLVVVDPLATGPTSG